jgi:hypothetical protein
MIYWETGESRDRVQIVRNILSGLRGFIGKDIVLIRRNYNLDYSILVEDQ